MNIFERPPIGFIVEGHGEYKSYPTLLCRILNASLEVPCINTRGFGGITSNLEEHLTDIAITSSPYCIIVTIDLCDAIENGVCRNCAELLDILDGKVDKWFDNINEDDRIQYPPERVKTVIQIQNLETWLISDPESLSQVDWMDICIQNCEWDNVDDDISNPKSWIKERCNPDINFKKPRIVSEIFANHDHTIMAENSNSFDKFLREAESLYSLWLDELNNE